MRKPPKSLVIFVILIVLLGSGTAVFYYKNIQAKADVTPAYTIVTVVKKDIKVALSADGKADLTVRNLKFSGNGILKELFVQEGQTVHKGDVLARLDASNLENQVKQAEANYNAAVAKYQRLLEGPSAVDIQAKKVAVASAEENLKVEQAVYDYKLKSLNDESLNNGKTTDGDILAEEIKLKAAKAQLETAQAQLAQLTPTDQYDLAAAKETVNQMAASLAIAKKNLEDTSLVAPADGLVMAVNGSVGELISSTASGSDSSTGTGFIVLADNQNIKVIANVIEDDIGKITVGQDVEVSFNALQDTTFTGKVTSISPNPVIDASGIVTYEVSAILANPENTIKSGMTGSVSFISQQAKGVLTIPVEAVTRVNGAPSVEVQHPDGTSGYVPVKTGLTDGKIVEVKSGLKGGDKVLLRKQVKNK